MGLLKRGGSWKFLEVEVCGSERDRKVQLGVVAVEVEEQRWDDGNGGCLVTRLVCALTVWF